MSAPLRVRVIANQGGAQWIGYYDHKRRKAGDEFNLAKPEDFSKKWMEPIGWEPKDYVKPVPKPAVTPKPSARTPLLGNKPVAQAAPATVQAPPAETAGTEAGNAGSDETVI